MSLEAIQTYYPSPISTDVKKTADFMVKQLLGESSGHDWWHIFRVWMNTRDLLQAENIQEEAEREIAEVTALLHDIADHKFHDGDEEIGPQTAYQFCVEQLAWKEASAQRVKEIIALISFKGAGVNDLMEDWIGQLVQDADRLDAIGAVGIARTFAYGGYAHQPITDPLTPPKFHQNADAYKSDKSSTINHFYEKLLLLEARMHTETAKKIAHERTQYMRQFLEQFFLESHTKR